MSFGPVHAGDEKEANGKASAEQGDTADVLGEHLKCTICHDVCDRPVTVRCRCHPALQCPRLAP